GLDADTVASLRSEGFQQVIVPPTSVAQAPTDGSAAVPFVVSGARGTQLTAVATDPDLTARFVGTADDPVLAAHQLVAELAQIYFEKPNAVTPRGEVVVPPQGWSTSPPFVATLLGALDGNPLLQPVTVSEFVSAVPTSTSCHVDCRLTGAPDGPGLPAAAIRTQRHRVEAFGSAAGGSASARSVGTQLSDLILSGESALLRPSQQVSVTASAGRALDAQLQHVAIGGGQVTLTSQQGTLPVTITSSAPYVVQATLSLSSDKLSFPGGGTQWTRPGVINLLPAPVTNVIEVPVHTRGSGLFPVEVVLRSPSGGLELATGTVDVRSTAASIVGIVLSVGAVLVLGAWWYRTSRRRRAARRAEETQDADEPVPAGVP
ncbi:MAG: hypothetical protein JO085_13890, partial [Acidimicrobiia bacterium]|nr:hypothetical protein [Acidimicrobiia bacterium]